MITNEKQLALTKEWIENFARHIAENQRRISMADSRSPMLELEIVAMESQLEELREEVAEYRVRVMAGIAPAETSTLVCDHCGMGSKASTGSHVSQEQMACAHVSFTYWPMRGVMGEFECASCGVLVSALSVWRARESNEAPERGEAGKRCCSWMVTCAYPEDSEMYARACVR